MSTQAHIHKTIERTGAVFAALTVYFVLMLTGLTTCDLVEGAAGAYANAGEPAAMALVALDGAYRTDRIMPSMGGALPTPRHAAPTCPTTEPTHRSVHGACASPSGRTPLDDGVRLSL